MRRDIMHYANENFFFGSNQLSRTLEFILPYSYFYSSIQKYNIIIISFEEQLRRRLIYRLPTINISI